MSDYGNMEKVGTIGTELPRNGRIHDVAQEELKEALGAGNVTVTFSLE